MSFGNMLLTHVHRRAKRRKRKDEKTKAKRRKDESEKTEKTKAKRRKDEKTKAKRRKDESEKTKRRKRKDESEKTKAKRRKDESEKTKRRKRKDESEKTERRKRKDEKTKRRKRKDENEKTPNSGLHVFVISLFRLRYFVMSPSLFRYVAFVISSFRLFAFVFSSFRFRLFVMAPSLCRREITKRRNGTNQPPYMRLERDWAKYVVALCPQDFTDNMPKLTLIFESGLKINSIPLILNNFCVKFLSDWDVTSICRVHKEKLMGLMVQIVVPPRNSLGGDIVMWLLGWVSHVRPSRFSLWARNGIHFLPNHFKLYV